MVRLHGTSGTIVIIPDNLQGSKANVTMNADPTDAHLFALFKWNGTAWVLIDKNSPLVF